MRFKPIFCSLFHYSRNVTLSNIREKYNIDLIISDTRMELDNTYTIQNWWQSFLFYCCHAKYDSFFNKAATMLIDFLLASVAIIFLSVWSTVLLTSFVNMLRKSNRGNMSTEFNYVIWILCVYVYIHENF